MANLSFYTGRTVLVTGHTGFKGSWMCKVLLLQGAKVIGYSLEAPTKPSLFEVLDLEQQMISVIGDIRDLRVSDYNNAAVSAGNSPSHGGTADCK